MATRRKGAFELAEVIETPKTMPLDARQLVRTKEEMLDTDSFPNGYKGMITAERTEGKLWMLMDHQNPTVEESWKVIGPYDDTALDARVTALEEGGGGGGVAQVQADWNETDTTSKAFIQNKPTIPPAYDDTALAARVTALEEAEIPPPSWDEVTDKPDNLATTDDVNAKVFVAEYNVTTAQEIMDYMDSSNEPYAPIVIKRDTNYHTVETMFKRNDETVVLRSTGTINGEYYMFTYAVTGNVWAISTDYGFQRKLESGTNIKTVGGQSLLGSGDIPVSGSQAQADWEETDTTSAAYIQNKPTIPEAYDDTAIQAALAGKADASSLANVATSGSYNDLGDKPTIPEAYDDSGLRSRVSALEAKTETQADWNETDTDSAAYIANKPTIPAAYDDTALAGRVTAVETALPGKADSSSLATVATSGSYNDLGDKPTIPEAYDDTALTARVTALEGRTDADTQADWEETDTTSPAFIQNKPTIPAEITVDAAMSDTSENPVQNKVVLEAITDAVDVVETAVQGLDTRVTALEAGVVDDALSDTSENPVQNKVIKSYVDNKTAVVMRYKVEMDDAASPESMVLKGDSEAALQPTMTFAGTSDTLEYSAENESGSYAITMPSKAYVDGALADKQDTLVSGTNIKTINGLSLVGEGNVILHQGVGDGLDVNDMPTYNEVEQMINDHALLYIDGNWLVQSIEKEGDTATIRGTFNNQLRSYYFDCESFDDPLVYQDRYTDGYTSDAVIWGSASGNQPYMEIQNGNNDMLRVWGLDEGITLYIKDRNGREVTRVYNITPNYIVDKPEGTPTQLGNVVQIGTLQRESGDKIGIFEFYYRTSALPNTTSKEFTLLPLLENYTVNDFIDATGMTQNGIFIGNGRTDNNNRLIVQQFSKNNKHFTIRTYQDFSAHTALVKIKFIGTKNA